MSQNDTREREPDAEDGPLLRPAMLDDGQPRFPLWLPLPGIAIAITWALYASVTAGVDAGGEFIEQLVWPGLPLFTGTTIAAYVGWRVDLD